VTSVNSVTNKVIGTTTITETEGDGILGVTLDPVADKLYVANASNDRIDIVDGTTLKVVDRITTGDQEPFGVAFNPFNHRLYVVYYSDKVDIFNAVNKSLITSTTVGTQNVNVAVNWITGNVFVTDNVFGPSTTAVLDENGNVLARVPVSESPYGVAVDPISNKAFVVSTGIAALNVIDGGSNTVVGAIPGLTANYVSVNYVTGKVYLSGNSGVVVTTE
jgi:YVTN family beta-propeller protein